ncbi:lysozyme [Jeotgalibaca porci]|uniref:lysozyme n=1 Tax=Jeotgalibaca porci TaxID=1868793 RepID=UPI00359FE4F1
MKIIFDEFRKLAGGKLTQAQVDKINALIDEIQVKSMRVDNEGIDLIGQFEGLRLNSYDDGVGVWTIGWGTTVYPNGQKVKKGDKITLEQAKQYKAHDLTKFEKAVNDAVKVPLNQNQFNALVSLAYNIGESAFTNSTLVKRLNDGNYKAAAAQFLAWVNPGGKRMQGLVNRRNKERELFLK